MCATTPSHSLNQTVLWGNCTHPSLCTSHFPGALDSQMCCLHTPCSQLNVASLPLIYSRALTPCSAPLPSLLGQPPHGSSLPGRSITGGTCLGPSTSSDSVWSVLWPPRTPPGPLQPTSGSAQAPSPAWISFLPKGMAPVLSHSCSAVPDHPSPILFILLRLLLLQQAASVSYSVASEAPFIFVYVYFSPLKH